MCRGAVVAGLRTHGLDSTQGTTIITRVSRHNYGVACRERFRESYHLPQDKAWIKAEGDFFAVNQMRWYLRRVSKVEKNVR